ncbi:hypothetical protein EYR36_008493 [Pleurotus pulmonarius]|nr:hypothetical protein EYR36_008493 [Pleurotus pulmonarius]
MLPLIQVPTTGLDIALSTGTFRGSRTDNITDKWLGIPYAQAPVGTLRFKAPRPISQRSNTIRDASKFGNVCPQPASGNLGAPFAEDCLFLNHSVQIGKPIAFASLNYRLNTFGFLAGTDVPPEDLNAGLLDQRLALAFLQTNIAAFGGDPAKVTIWGQSAGAGSVQTHVLFPPNQPLFRAVIANSATGPIKNAPPPSTYSLPGKPFTRLLAATGCSSGRGAVACLQKVPTDVNEGATFTGSVRNLNLTGAAQAAAFDNLIGHLVIDNSSLTSDVFDRIHSLFRENDPALGAPFNTGDSLFDRAEAWYTAQNYIGPRRLFFEAGSPRQPMFAYYFREFIPGNDPSLGASWPRYDVHERRVMQLLRGNVTLIPDDWDTDKSDFTIDVGLRTGTFRGIRTANGTEKWLGVPFAQPPLGSLRFKAPRPITTTSTAVRDASTFGNACPQIPSQSLGAPISEDCLVLNIWRPEGTTKASKLPILVWEELTQMGIIQRSVAMGKPIMFASVNYRLNTFGFLASSSVAPEDLNAGLLDQRLALTFLQDNIAAFGGDPAKVTIWGQSAGAGSVESHVLFPPRRKLFRAAIADSSTGPFKNDPPPSTYDKPGKPFTRLLAATGCGIQGAVACLQQVPFETLLNISNSMIRSTLNSQLWQPTIHPANFINERPSQRVLRGNFAHIPYLAGTNINEGTTFSGSVRNLRVPAEEEDAAFDNFIDRLAIDNSTYTSDVFDGIHSHFPADDSSLGAPFNTGDSLFDRAESWYTVQNYLGPRRLFFENAASRQPMFAYYFKEFIPGNDPALGGTYFHNLLFVSFLELPLLFGPIPNAVETDFANQMLGLYINFVHDMNPGATWPQYTQAGKQVLQLMRGNITAIPDDFDVDKTDFVNSERVLAEFQK